MASPLSLQLKYSDADDFPDLTVIFEKDKAFCICDICTEFKQMSSINDCVHAFCIDCITKLISSKLENNIATVQCPGLNCDNFIQIQSICHLLPKSVVDSWNDALCRNLLNDLQKLYCPFRDCSAMMLIDDNNKIATESECPSCHRLFCARCKVAWHSGISCEEYERLNEDEKGKDDLMMMKLANEKKWRRCPRCKFYVEKTQGCPHITCRCKFQFCYGCGLEWNPRHAAAGCH